VLSVDDDTRCRIGEPPDREDTVTAFAGYDPTEFWFFPDRAGALESVASVDDDVLGRHEALLGQDAGAAGSRSRSAASSATQA